MTSPETNDPDDDQPPPEPADSPYELAETGDAGTTDATEADEADESEESPERRARRERLQAWNQVGATSIPALIVALVSAATGAIALFLRKRHRA